jgi:hypothetical protein
LAQTSKPRVDAGQTQPTPAGASPMTAEDVGGLLHPRTAPEMAAGVAPTTYTYATNDIRRYGGDPSGVADNTQAFQTLFKVMLHAGGGSTVLPPGTYKLNTSITQTLTNAALPNGIAHGLTIYGYGAVIEFTGSGYVFDFLSPNTSATFYQPQVVIFGLNFKGTSAASGALRTSDLSSGRYYDVYGIGFTSGAAFSLRNSVSWSENTRFIGCGAINCKTGISFVVAGGNGSYARTRVEHFFGAGISDYWFDVGPGSAVYDSVFTHISGNFGAIAYFGIGAPGKGADMTSTVIDGIDCERNGAKPGQSIIRLRDYPQSAGNARRPKVLNIGLYAGYTGSGFIPTWANANGEKIAGPEVQQIQVFNVENPVVSDQGQSAFWEANYGVGGASRNAATSNSTITTCKLIGCNAAVAGRVVCSRSGPMAGIAMYDAIKGTSNANTMMLIGLPVEVTPSAERDVACFVENNGVLTPAIATLSTGGTISFAVATSSNAYSAKGFADSGTKGLTAGATICYPL